MTSLEQQLRKLALPESTLFLHEKKKPSLLFDAKDAANLERDTIYDLGLNGLEQLENLDRSFRSFYETLFSESAKTLQRSVQTKEINAKLDTDIEAFLIRVSPFFLIRPAHEALEWLIYRFHIHEYNVDALIGCILPHHDSKWFSRALALINVGNPTNKWHWLYSLQKAGLPLARSTLFTHLYSDVGFLTFISDLVLNTVKVYHVQTSKLQMFFSFYATSICGAILYAEKIPEVWITKLVPYIFKGLKSSVPDYVISTYMIIGALVYKLKLNSTAVFSLIKQLMSKMTDLLLPNGLNCLVLICNTQIVKEFDHGGLKNFIQNSLLVETLYNLSLKKDISSLLSVLLPQLVKLGLQEKITKSKDQRSIKMLTFLRMLLNHVSLNDKLAVLLVRTVLWQYLEFKGKLVDEKIDKKIQPIIRFIEKRYSKVFDEELQKFTSLYGKTSPDVVKSFIDLSLSSSKHQVLSSDGDTLIMSLNHVNPVLRCVGIKNLYLFIKKGQNFECKFIEESLLSRLGDDDIAVVKEVLKMPPEVVEMLDKQRLIETLCNLLNNKPHNLSWNFVYFRMLNILLKCFGTEEALNDRIAHIVLPFLFMYNKNRHKLLTVLITSEFFNHYVLFKELSTAFSKDCEILLEDLLIHLANQFLQLTDEDLTSKLSFFFQDTHHDENLRLERQFIGLCLIHAMIKKETNLSRQLDFACKAIVFSDNVLNIKSSQLYDPIKGVDQKALSDCFYIIHEGGVPEIKLLHFLKEIASIVRMPEKLEGIEWWSLTSSDTSIKNFLIFTLKLFDFVIKEGLKANKNNLAKILKILKENLLKNKCNLLKFLSILATCHCYEDSDFPLTISRNLQALSLYQVNVILTSMTNEEISDIVHGNLPVIKWLLIAVSCPVLTTRSAALSCFVSLKSKCQNINAPFTRLISTLADHCEELSGDVHHLQYCVKLIFDMIEESFSKKKPSKIMQAKQKMIIVSLKSLLNVITDEMPASLTVCLLQIMSGITGKVLMQQLLPLLKKLVNRTLSSEKLSNTETKLLILIISKFTSNTTSLFQNSEDFQLFLQILQTHVDVPSNYESPQIVALEQITKEFFSALPAPGLQQKVLGLLLDILSDNQETMLVIHVGKAIKRISLQADQILTEFRTVGKSTKPSCIKDAKRLKRSSTLPAKSEMESRAWRRIVLFLELLQNKKKIKDAQLLIPELFNLMKQLLEQDIQSTTEYAKQLVLTFIHNICVKLASEDPINFANLHSDKFNVELIVQCIRVSENPQTHRQALVLLATAAKMFPDHVLHNIMAIFTFMKNNILRQDDSYSFQVITKTVETIIPILIMSRQHSLSSLDTIEMDNMVLSVTRVFVDAFPHIPKHRQLSLFTHLVINLGPENFLWIIIALLLDIIVRKIIFQDEIMEDSEKDFLHPVIEFLLDLIQQFKPKAQVLSLKKLLKFLLTLPDEKVKTDKVESKKKKSSQESVSLDEKGKIFDVDTHSGKELRHFKFITLSYIVLSLNSPKFITEIVKLSHSENIEMQSLYKELLEENLHYIYRIAGSLERYSQEASARYWKALLNKSYEVLDKVNSLLPSSIFIHIVIELMKNELPSVRRKAMELLNTKLQRPESFAESEVDLLLKLLKPLMSVADATRINQEEEAAVNRQTALFSLKLLIRILAPKYPEEIRPMLQLIVKVFATPNNTAVASSALLCLAEFCASLKVLALQHLPDFMPYLIYVLDNKEELLSNDLFLLSAVTALHKIVASLPHFLSSYLLDILKKVVILSCLSTGGDLGKSQLHLRLKAIRNILATVVAPRILLPAVADCYGHISVQDPKAICWLMVILEDCLAYISKDDLTSHQALLYSFFLNAFDFRCCYDAKYSLDKISEIEEHMIKAILAMVWRLSENYFRTFYLKLFDWATKPDSPKDRLLVFYRLTYRVAEKLKGLFILFAGIFIKNAADVLNANNFSKTDMFFEGINHEEKSSLLLQFIFSSLQTCFEHENEGFVNKDRFDTLLDPLVDQIENTLCEEKMQDRISKFLVPCIAQFAVSSPDSWKTLNYRILLKTRHSSAKVRFAALKVLLSIVEKLGDAYSPLLPESIPFLAELMEDESSEVEAQCQEVIQKMESILGESLKKYF